MAWGFFKKLVVADRLALYVNDVYAAPQNFNGLQLTVATVFFAYQIYCDFSGYSDIAIGTARVLGFELMENFNTPYYSRSISEFWHRWHISLSTWFRDYLYIPLGGSRVGIPRWIINILITFGVSGLWHGANWTYVIWGLLNGFYLLLGSATSNLRSRAFRAVGLPDTSAVRKLIGVAGTFGFTLLAWVLFRAKTLDDAGYILTHFCTNWDFAAVKTPQFQLKYFPVAVGAIISLETIQLLQARTTVLSYIPKMPWVLRWATYILCIFAIILFGVYHKTQFIYFQF